MNSGKKTQNGKSGKIKYMWPKISVITPCLNSSRTLAKAFSSLREQDYPQENLELLLIDGGSSDGSQEIAKDLGAQVVDGGYRDNMEARRGIGLHLASHELVFYLDTDNILPSKNYLQQMVKPFLNHKELVASQTWRYGIADYFTPFNRYCALIGANDPVAFYLNKCEKLCHAFDNWYLTKIKADYGDYFLVDFTLNNLPTVGANGFLIKRDLLLKARCKPEEFFHIDVISDLVKDGFNPFAMVRNEIYHDTAHQLSNLAIKRMKYFMRHNPSRSARRYFVFDVHRPKDLLGIAKFMFFTATLIEPIALSWRGYKKKKDWAWFLHPIVCWHFLFAYAFSSTYLFVKTKLIITREKLRRRISQNRVKADATP